MGHSESCTHGPSQAVERLWPRDLELRGRAIKVRAVELQQRVNRAACSTTAPKVSLSHSMTGPKVSNQKP